MEIRINSKYLHLKDFIESIPNDIHKIGKTVYKDRNEIKVVETNGILVNIKSYQIPHHINKFAYAFIRKSKAKRTYLNAHRLQNYSVNTPEPIAYINCYKNALLWKSYFISRHLSYISTLRDINSYQKHDRERLLQQFTRFTYYSLLQNKVHHLDYSRGNILIDDSGQLFNFNIVDINRMRFETMNYKKGLKVFAKLWALDDELDIIGKEYAKLTDKEDDKTVALLKEMDKKHKAKINQKNKLKEWLRK